MSEIGSQQDYWNSRAAKWTSYGTPLIPDEKEIDFMRQQLVPGGDVLILGATPQLCSMAVDVSRSVTAVDFAQDVIDMLHCDGVHYECLDWNEFFEQETNNFDAIMTDGGLLCLEFPESWEELASNIRSHLRPGGIFSARVYVSTSETPKENYDNPNLARFIPGMAKVDEDFMVRVQTNDDYKSYNVRYAFPPEQEVMKVFHQFVLRGKFIPDYEEGDRFLSYAWQRCDA